MTKEECIELMKSSKSDLEWDQNCDKVKRAHDGQYPEYWFETFIRSGLISQILGRPDAGDIKVFGADDLVKKWSEN